MLVTDFVASTSVRHVQGELPAHERMALIESVVISVAAAKGGRFVKNTGDGQLVVFESARSALTAAVDLQRRIHRLNGEDPAKAILVRAGIHTGEAILEGSDVQGTAVVAAFRINARADGEEVLVSEMVRGVLGGANEFTFIERGRFALKGFRERWRLYQVPWRAAAAAPEESECAILFSDVDNSTETSVELGGWESYQYLRASNAIFRAAATANGAVCIRLFGDSGMALFPTAVQGVRAAVDVRRAAAAYSRENPVSPMRMAMGMHVGRIVREAEEVYGLSLVIASRIMGLAAPDELLLTQDAVASLPPATFQFGAPRVATLKAIPGEWLLSPFTRSTQEAP